MSEKTIDTAFIGHQPRECGEHRTVGSHRAWCYDCSEWCYPSTEGACKGCRLPALTRERDEAVRERDAPIPMRLACPACSEYHIDRGEWATRPHKTHLCEHCETEWRPSQRYTVGVDSLTASTGGSSDEPQKEIRE